MALCSLGLPAVDHLALRAWEGLLLGALVNGAQSGAGQGREPRMGRIILATFSFAFTLSSISRSSVMKVVEIFFAGNSKEN